jgi:wyosine [tRNA(Phe)-imidazoG37] synthetase (radical SAM superfamily)
VLHGEFLPHRVSAGSRRVADLAISGNGEPTSASEIGDVIERIQAIKTDFRVGPEIPVRLITNGSLVGRAYVQRALASLSRIGGEVWFKVDAGTAEGMARINGVRINPQHVVRNLSRCTDLCPTWVQTCVFALDGAMPTDADVAAYLDLLRAAGLAHIRGVLLYGIARPSLQPEAPRLARLSPATIEVVAGKIRSAGLTVHVSP